MNGYTTLIDLGAFVEVQQIFSIQKRAVIPEIFPIRFRC